MIKTEKSEKKMPEAVAAVLCYKDEIFLIRRQIHLKAFPGYHAFPGGKIEQTDSEYLNDLSESLKDKYLASLSSLWLGALARELEEELGWNFKDCLRQNTINSLHHLGTAETPDFNPIRFRTHFFAINLEAKPQFVLDEGEVFSGEWLSAQNIVKKWERGELLSVPPVVKIFKSLATFSHLNEWLVARHDLEFRYDALNHVPMIEPVGGFYQYMPFSHTLPPAERTNAFYFGDESALKILVDPSPRDEMEKNKLLKSLEGKRIDRIFLTHHHPDHHQYSVELAKTWKCPLVMSAVTKSFCEKKWPAVFNSIAIELVKEGDTLTRWNDEAVKIMEVPGHDQGQLALYPESLKWFIASDLFQGVGTVVVGGPEGNMQLYFETLKKVIALNPQVVFPSHGIGLGSPQILQKTLEHRILRENQVLSLLREGKTIDDMLKIIYADLPSGLIPYARENILSHQKKLQLEGRI